jgi:hypothetical protein
MGLEITVRLEFHWSQILFIVLAFLSVWITAQLRWYTASRRPQEAAKLKCRRIRDIPITTTEESLRSQPRESLGDSTSYGPQTGEGDPLCLTLARSSPGYRMATITSHIYPTNTAYPVDTDFIGVTPLFESDDTDVE